MEHIKKLTPEQIQNLFKCEEAIKRARESLYKQYGIIREELSLPTMVLGFLYYEKPVKTDKHSERGIRIYEQKEFARVAYLTKYEILDTEAIARFCSVNKSGKPGNRIELWQCRNVSFEPFDGTVEEAKKILQKTKNNITIT